MGEPKLREEGRMPDDPLLTEALGPLFRVYQEFMQKIQTEPFLLQPQWRYYHDGKAWLCKIVFGKKTICWLSVWDGFFVVTFYFSEKHQAKVEELGVDKAILERFLAAKRIGRLMPLVVEVNDREQLNDLLRIARLKKAIK